MKLLDENGLKKRSVIPSRGKNSLGVTEGVTAETRTEYILVILVILVIVIIG